MNGIDPNTRLIDLTVGQLYELIASATEKATSVAKSEKRHAYGLAGIASTFGCSRRTAERIKASGVIDGAISQCGRTIVVDVEKALQLYSINKNISQQ